MIFGILVGLMIFAVGMLFVNFLMPDIDTARVGLDCTNTSISDGAKVSCLGTDIAVPFFIVTVISAAGGYITARLLL